MILVDAGHEGIAQFSKDADKTYSVIQRSSNGVIIEHHKLGLTGYVLPHADAEIEKGVISRVTSPCLVMTEQRGENGMTMSVCNPDLGWKSGIQFDSWGKDKFRPPIDPVPMPMTLTLRGQWKLVNAHPEVSLSHLDAGGTNIKIDASDARSIEFVLGSTD